MKKNAFLNFIEGTSIIDTLKKLSKIRESDSWKVLSSSNTFNSLTSYQKTELESIMKEEIIEKGKNIIYQGQLAPKAYIISSGSCIVFVDGGEIRKKIKELNAGDFIGNIYTLQKDLPSPYSFVAQENMKLFSILKKDVIRFVRKNPGIYMRLLRSVS